ncbi:Abscisic acid G-protein coupled receptor-domain-containing protein [Cercophora newfieldiana]|uniref:Abscisic acid G-protein coupled receptor-domain-containing protein n=1 Tax=Cercophora newfieldiana TaxID=92897 RepID=A0AA40CR78_9PEZI|nr:Abscisic acid G-protein coupled receptor-domain-containing protein [Cercophora newfieldiana]
MLPSSGDGGGASSCSPDADACTPPGQNQSALSTIISLSPFLATFAVVFSIAAMKIFPRLARLQAPGADEVVLPQGAPPSLRQAQEEYVKSRRRVVAVTFASTVGLAAVLGVEILCEILEVVGTHARTVGLRVTVPVLLVLLVGVIPMLEHGDDGGLARACLERVGVIGISLMALLSGFASVSSPWHTFADNRSYRRRPITDADLARKEAGREATSELLLTKRHRLRALQKKVADGQAAANAGGAAKVGMMGKMIGSLKGIAGGGGDAAEIKLLQLEISGLETMEANLSASLSLLRTRKAVHARDGTVLGKLLAIPSYAFSMYCVYRVLATILTTVRRATYPNASFSSSDPINRFLGLLAKHWDPKLDQMAWARQISFLLSGVILAASANSVLQTFHLFSKWMPGLLYQAQANLALLIGQIAATYVISSALLLRSNLPREVGRSVGDALESALEPGFVDRWFEGWFLAAAALTAIGIFLGKKLNGAAGDWDDWDELAGEEMGVGQKRS